MVVNRKPTGRAVSMPMGLLMGAAFALIWTVIGAMGVAKLIDSGKLAETSIGYGAMVILLTGAFGAAMVSFCKVKRQRALVCGAAGLIYFLILLSINALFFGGQYAGVGVTALVILAGCGCAILLGLRPEKGKGRRPVKIPKR